MASNVIKSKCAEIQKEADTMMAYVKEPVDNEPTMLIGRIDTIRIYQARSGELLANAKYLYRVAQRDAVAEAIADIADKKIPAKMQNALLEAQFVDQLRLVEFLDRLNSACTHSLDTLRSILSYMKSELEQTKSPRL